MSRRQLLAFLLLSLIWGSTWAAIRVAVLYMPPLRSVSIRFLLAGLFLAPIVVLRRHGLPKRREWIVLCVMSLTMITVPFGLVAWAQQHISSGLTAILFAISPLLTAILEPRFGSSGSRPVSRRALFALALGLMGVFVVLVDSVSATRLQAEGIVAIICAMVVGSVGSILIKDELQRIPLLSGSVAQFWIAGAFIGLGSLLLEHDRKTVWNMHSIAAVLFLALVSSGIGFLLYYWLLQQLEPYKVASRQLIMPLVAIAEGVVFLHEPLSRNMLVGASLVLTSLVMIFTMRSTATESAALLHDESAESIHKICR
jgi:drug/metabolite transporter (DMT)-like permease